MAGGHVIPAASIGLINIEQYPGGEKSPAPEFIGAWCDLAIESNLSEPLLQVLRHSVQGLNRRPPMHVTIEMRSERVRVVVFVEFETDGDNVSVAAGCEPGKLAYTLVEPFAHCGHFSSQIGRRHPDFDRAHVHPPSFLKTTPSSIAPPVRPTRPLQILLRASAAALTNVS
jgi:hypothetical protein